MVEQLAGGSPPSPSATPVKPRHPIRLGGGFGSQMQAKVRQLVKTLVGLEKLSAWSDLVRGWVVRLSFFFSF
jgi:hypothetical protein